MLRGNPAGLALLASLIVQTGWLLPAVAQEQELSLSLEASADVVVLGDEITFAASLSASSSVRVPRLLFDDRSVSFEIRRKDPPGDVPVDDQGLGRVWSYTRWSGKRKRPAPLPWDVLAAGQSQECSVGIVFPEAGTYLVRAVYRGHRPHEHGTGAIEVQVRPRGDARRLWVVLEIEHPEVMGAVNLEMFPQHAFGNVLNFLRLTADGFYDGTRFHRIIDGFMSQGGDPLSKNDIPEDDGKGGPGYQIPAECDPDRFTNAPHELGAVSMAHDLYLPDTAGSQFFLCDREAGDRNLDEHYTVFGRIAHGLEVAHHLNRVPKVPEEEDASVPSSRPVTLPVLVRATVVPEWAGPPAPLPPDVTARSSGR